MEVRDLKQLGNRLHAKFSFQKDTLLKVKSFDSQLFTINDCIYFQLRVTAGNRIINGNVNTISMFVRLTKLLATDNTAYSVDCTIEDAEYGNTIKRFVTDDSEWRVLRELNVHLGSGMGSIVILDPKECTFEMTVTLNLIENTPFALLYDDTELTDFELRCDEGAVRVHSMLLAARSPVLRTMLLGKWRETESRALQVADTSILTLRHFKDYLYLATLPETGIEELLLLATRYMIDDMVQRCTDALISKLTATNFMEFAIVHNMTKLQIKILRVVQNGHIQVADIEQYLDKSHMQQDS